LVKNAYDADATLVLIDYLPSAKPPMLVVEDDGHGMTVDDLTRGWMAIGTDVKEEHPKSPKYGRARTGQKGIGRFAAQRLGNALTLRSQRGGSEIEISFDWTKYKAGIPLEDIQQPLREGSASKSARGTRLEISGLHRDWSRQDLEKVLLELIHLRGPGGTSNKEDPGFDVAVSIEGDRLAQNLEELDLLREERVMTVEGTVDAKGRGEIKLHFHRPKRKEQLVEQYKKPLRTGPLKFSLELFVLKSPEKLGIRQLQLLLKKYGGAKIWRDGFKLSPYGEPENDWLGIEGHVAARRPPLNMWRNQNMLGGVQLTAAKNPDFVELLTRRGLVENAAFHDLRHFVFEALTIAAIEHGAVTAKKSRGRAGKSKPSKRVLRQLKKEREQKEAESQALLGELRAALEAKAISRKVFDRVQSHLSTTAELERDSRKRIVRAVRRGEEDLLDHIEMLRILASLGTGLAAFSHELRMVGQSIGIATQEIEACLGTLPTRATEEVREHVGTLRSGLNDLATYRSYIDDFIRIGARRKRDDIELEPHLKKLITTFRQFLDQRRIKITFDVPRGLHVRPMHKAELNSIVFNLLTNAVKAMLAPEATARNLLFRARASDEEVTLLMADTGCGIPEAIKERIFDAFVTRTHVQDEDFGSGTGLGLTIVQEMVIENDGSIAVVTPPDGFVTAFEVRLPARSA
jgi:signal transduction histidine kinase